MKNFLPRLTATITRHPRYRPELEWSAKSWTHNIFRCYEQIFGRRFGIKREISISTWLDENGAHVIRVAHTWESAISIAEEHVRKMVTSLRWVPIRIDIPVFWTPQGFPVFASPYLFAIAHDADSNNYTASNAGSYTTSHTVGAGSNRFIIAGAAGSTVTVTGETYNGTSLTALTVTTGINNIYTDYLVAPASGANNFVTSFSGGTSDIQLFSISYSGVKQTAFPDASSFTQSATGNLTFTLTTIAANAWMWSLARNGSAGPCTASTGTTDRSSGTRYFSGGDSNGALAAGSNSMAWTTTGSASTTYGPTLSFAPATAATPQSEFVPFF